VDIEAGVAYNIRVSPRGRSRREENSMAKPKKLKKAKKLDPKKTLTLKVDFLGRR
jgi:hypothetical protein